MRRLMKNTFSLLMTATAAMLFSGCEQDPQFTPYEYPMPEATGISPLNGYVTTQVVITGTNFGDRTEPVKVFFGGVQSEKVLMCKNNRLAVEVPEGAVSGKVSLQIWTHTIDSIGQYTVLPTPKLISVLSENASGAGIAAPGDIVNIKGINFGTDPKDISVSFNGTPAEFTLQDEGSIVAVTPQSYVSGMITVTVHGYTMEGSPMLNPTQKGEVTSVYLRNTMNFREINPTNYRGWYTPADWNVNDATYNNDGGSKDGSCLQIDKGNRFIAFQYGWGKGALNNGKVWQEAQLVAGKYRFEVDFSNSKLTNPIGDRFYAYIARGRGENAIPSVENIATLDGAYIEYTNRPGGEDAGTLKVTLELQETTNVVIGFLASVNSKDNYFKVKAVRLILE